MYDVIEIWPDQQKDIKKRIEEKQLSFVILLNGDVL